MRVRLAPGAKIDDAVLLLEELATNAYSVGAFEQHPSDRRDEYVRWTMVSERRLRGVLARQDAESFFDSPRHRDICSMPAGSQIVTLLQAELDARALDFGDVAEHLRQQRTRMTTSRGLPIVVDSNVLLQCRRPDQLDWSAQVGEIVRVMLPLRVVEEVDSKKYSGSRRLSRVARGLMPWIDGLFPDGNTGPVSLRRSEATIELLLADRPRHRPADADEEVLDVCHEVRHLVGQVKVMTGDTAMRVRARSEGLDVLVIPDGWRRVSEDDDEDPSGAS